jgi:hypothetical protein
MNYLSDWFWQNVVPNLVADTMLGLAVLAWKHRRALYRKPVLLSAASGGKSGAAATPRVYKDVDLSWNVYSRASKDADLRWRVEAPTPSLARRLEELATWYLHVS